jgi:hypothetical protein
VETLISGLPMAERLFARSGDPQKAFLGAISIARTNNHAERHQQRTSRD